MVGKGDKTPNPWLEVQGMKEKMDKLMDEVRERFDFDKSMQRNISLWQPVTDVYEKEGEYVIKMELAGMEREDVQVVAKGRELWVYGERKRIKELTGSSYQIMERQYGPFARKFHLPGSIDSDNIQASYENGLLTIVVVKQDRDDVKKDIQISQD
ncbi:MAG: Hsp20/alpha crystallin family protein [Thermodesulfobacteriota bacterium]